MTLLASTTSKDEVYWLAFVDGEHLDGHATGPKSRLMCGRTRLHSNPPESRGVEESMVTFCALAKRTAHEPSNDKKTQYEKDPRDGKNTGEQTLRRKKILRCKHIEDNTCDMCQDNRLKHTADSHRQTEKETLVQQTLVIGNTNVNDEDAK